MSLFVDPLSPSFHRSQQAQDLQRQQMSSMQSQAMGRMGLGGIGQHSHDPYRDLLIECPAPKRKKTVREELQSEINDWLKDV